MELLRCAVYLALTGLAGFFLGRIVPGEQIDPEKGLFRSFPFEKGGAIYEKMGIRKWHKRLPDMSRILPFAMPAKNLLGDYEKRLSIMIRETCVAEAVHIAVSITGLRCLWIWPGIGGIAVTMIHILLLNLPFIMIQRYNRPRLLRLQKKKNARKKQKEAGI